MHKLEMGRRFYETCLQRDCFVAWKNYTKFMGGKKKLRDLEKQKELAKVKVDEFLQNLNSVKKLLHSDMDKSRSAAKNKKPVPVSTAWRKKSTTQLLTPMMSAGGKISPQTSRSRVRRTHSQL